MESKIVDRALAVIGDAGDAFRWLGTPVRALGYETGEFWSGRSALETYCETTVLLALIGNPE